MTRPSLRNDELRILLTDVAEKFVTVFAGDRFLVMAGHVVPMEVLRGIFVDVRIKEGDAALLSSPLLGLPVVRLRLTWMLMEIEGRRMTQGTQTAQSLNAYRVLRLRPSR